MTGGLPMFVIRSADGGAEFSLTPSGDASRSYRASLMSGLMSASVDVGVTRKRLTDLFGGMARDWRGWEGIREVTLMPPTSDYAFPVCRLVATSDGRGHVTLRCQMADPWLPSSAKELFATHVGPGPLHDAGSWAVEVLLALEAGGLDGIAHSLADLPFDSAGTW